MKKRATVPLVIVSVSMVFIMIFIVVFITKQLYINDDQDSYSIVVFITKKLYINDDQDSYSMVVLNMVIVSCLVALVWTVIASSGKIKVADRALRKEVVKFQPNPKLATLYISRSQRVGFAIAFPIIINDVNTIWTKGKTFYRLDLLAGAYTLTGNQKCNTSLSLNLNAGEITYVEQEILIGLTATGYRFRLIHDPAAAQADIQICKLLQAPEIK